MLRVRARAGRRWAKGSSSCVSRLALAVPLSRCCDRVGQWRLAPRRSHGHGHGSADVSASPEERLQFAHEAFGDAEFVEHVYKRGHAEYPEEGLEWLADRMLFVTKLEGLPHSAAPAESESTAGDGDSDKGNEEGDAAASSASAPASSSGGAPSAAAVHDSSAGAHPASLEEAQGSFDVCDLGAGTGTLSLGLLPILGKRLGRDATVVGVEPVHALRTASAPAAGVIEGNSYAVPLGDESVQASPRPPPLVSIW